MLVMLACRRLLADHEANQRDVMIAAGTLHNQVGELPPDEYDHSRLDV